MLIVVASNRFKKMSFTEFAPEKACAFNYRGAVQRSQEPVTCKRPKFADPKGSSRARFPAGHTKTRPEPSQLAEIADMTDSSIARITGMFGVACVLLSWAQFPLWVIGGAPPFYDSEALARHLYDIRTTAFIRILMDQGIYVSMMIFAAGFRHLVRRARPESDWLGLLALVSAAVWCTLGFRGRLSRVVGRSRVERWGYYFLRIARRLRRGCSLRPRGGSGSVGAMTFAFSLL